MGKEVCPPADTEDSTGLTTPGACILGFRKLLINDHAPGGSTGVIHPNALLNTAHLEQPHQRGHYGTDHLSCVPSHA